MNKFVFHLIIFKFEMELLLGKVVIRAYLLQSFSNGLVFGTDNPVSLLKTSNISNNFEWELVRSLKLLIRKRRTKRAPA